MDPDQETHTVTGATGAGGTAVFDYDPATDTLSWVIEHSGMTADPSAGHIHAAADPGVNAGIVLDLLANSQGNASPIVGSVASPAPELLGYMHALRAYVNLHTAMNTQGEIRGQLAPIVFGNGFEGD